LKIAITGHSSGIGLAIARQYGSRGHEIIGLSRRNGYNIRSLHKIVGPIADCDWFINNAQAGFAQTELLFAIYEQWQDQSHKFIMNISTKMTRSPLSTIPGLGYDAYRTQKLALEEAHMQLAFKQGGPRMMLVRPGEVATGNGIPSKSAADADAWASALISMIELAGDKLNIAEISLGPNRYGS